MRTSTLFISVVLAATPLVSLGQTTTNDGASAIIQLQAQIQTLLQQIQTLQQQIDATRKDVRDTRQELRSAVKEFRTQLRQGMRGDEVLLLQELLATDSELYPEGLITGYFGLLTNRALIRFQLKHGIDGVGEVGPQTRRALNAFIKKDIDNAHKISEKLLKKFEVEDDDDFDENDDSTATSTDNGQKKGRGTGKVLICHVPSGNPAAAHTITIAAPALNAHLGHGDSLGACADEKEDEEDDDDDTATTTPDTIAPTISDVTSTSTTASTTRIIWNTNELATSKVWYHTTSPLDTAIATFVSSSILIASHDMQISDLTASTTYYYIVESADAAGNMATSSEHFFTTL